MWLACGKLYKLGADGTQNRIIKAVKKNIVIGTDIQADYQIVAESTVPYYCEIGIDKVGRVIF